MIVVPPPNIESIPPAQRIIHNTYRDSVSLMQISSRIAAEYVCQISKEATFRAGSVAGHPKGVAIAPPEAIQGGPLCATAGPFTTAI